VRRPDDLDVPPPPTGAAVAVVDAGRAQRSAKLAKRRSNRRAGRVVKVGAAILGEWRKSTSIGHSGLENSTQERASARLRELADLARWRGRYGVVSNVDGWLRVVRNALLVLDGAGRWKFDEKHLLGYLPPGSDVREAQVRKALWRPSDATHLMSNATAGRHVELVAAEHDEIVVAGGPLCTIDPVDETPEQRKCRRADRERIVTCVRVRGWRAKQNALNATRGVTANATCGVTVQTSYSMGRYKPHVALDVTAAIAAGATTVAEVAVAMGREPQKVRREVERAARNGRIVRTGRGRYALLSATNSVVAHAEGGSAPPAAATKKRCDKDVTATPALVLAALGRVPSATAAELSRDVGKSRNPVAMALLRLFREGQVVRLDDGRHALPTPPPPAHPKSAGGGLPPLPAADREE